MRRIALQMLFGDSAKFYGILLGLTFATLLITQQSAIFVGLMTRTYALIEEIPQADLWVADPTLQFVDDTKPMAVMMPQALPPSRSSPARRTSTAAASGSTTRSSRARTCWSRSSRISASPIASHSIRP